MIAAIQVSQVTKHYGALAALAGVDLSIAQGEFFGLLGASFLSRKAALRANHSVLLTSSWAGANVFSNRYANNDLYPNNHIVPNYTFGERKLGIQICAQITASQSRFPIADANDWPNLWELWQHYYAQAFCFGRDYGIERYGMFNEPNNWTWPAETKDPLGNWLRRLQLASDAIQSALADVNSRYGKALRPQIFAPNTANGATKYNDTVTGDTWGHQAVTWVKICK